MQSIARKAALSQSTAYRHFPSVEVLVKACHEDVMTSLAEHGERSRKDGKELFEHQAMFDLREIMDLTKPPDCLTNRWVRRLSDTFYGALRG